MMENEGQNKPFDVEHMKALVTYGAYHFENGVRTFADFSKKMVDDIGDWIGPYLKEARTKIEEMKIPKVDEPASIPIKTDSTDQPSTENQKLEQENKNFGMAINPFIKKSLAIFIFLAIIISLFPPFEFGNEKLRTISERRSNSIFADNLPIKKYDFIFSSIKKKVLLEHSYNNELSRYYLLDRKILFGELLVEYILAFFVSIALGYGIRSKRMSFLVFPKAIKRSLKIYFSTGRLWSGKK